MQRRKAFTLIELLVVIAIIAILAAILFPVFAQARAAAKKTARLSDMKQMSTAAIMYAGDYDSRSLLAWSFCVDGDAGCSTTQRTAWPQRVFPYTKSSALMIDASGTPKVFPGDMTITANFGAGPNMAMNWHAGGGIPDTQPERISELIMFTEAYARDWFNNGSIVRASSNLNPWDWRDIWGGMDVSDGARRSLRCQQYEKRGSAWFQNHYDPQDAWSIDWRHQDGASAAHYDGSAKFYKMGGLRPENWYVTTIPAHALDGRNNCDF